MKILMAQMGLNIGGAETHVVELSKALTAMGHSVVIASNGGVFVNEIEKHGIKHIYVPLNKKSPLSLLKSYLILKKMHKKEGFDILHAHARIPAFICHFLSKSLKINFITTVHGIYNSSFLLRKSTHWGERSIAMSSDIKKELIEKYDQYSDNVFVSVNGINTEKYSKNVKSDIKKELGLTQNEKIILHVSRLDKSSIQTAELLIDSMQTICKNNNFARLVIVGDGDAFSDVYKKAVEVNSKMGKNIVFMTGKRLDINKFLSSADVFVGVSRAALEAMSSEVPVILCGNPLYNQGYGGIFTESQFNERISDNFCCRKKEYVSCEKLAFDILFLLDANDEYIYKLTSFNRNVVLKHYSVKKMANDCINVYNTLKKPRINKSNDIVISGYYGFSNMGDDSLLLAFINKVKKEKTDINITVFSKKPQKMECIYGVKCVNRFNFFKIFKEIKNTKLLITGGGTLLQDSTSTRSFFYYLSIIKIAVHYNKKIFLYANGLGPINKKSNIKKIKKIIPLIDKISLREKESYEYLKNLGIKCDNVSISADPVFLLDNADCSQNEYLYLDHKLDNNKKYYIIATRGKNLPIGFENALLEVCQRIESEYHMTPIFVAMQEKVDYALAERLSSKIKNSITIKNLSANDFINFINDKAEFVIGMRLHSAIYSMLASKPIIGIVYDPKIEYFFKYIESKYYIQIDEFDFDKFFYMVSSVLQHKNEITTHNEKKLYQLKKLAAKDIENINSLLID